jgi:histone-lysine N-methyltransferase SETMAR
MKENVKYDEQSESSCISPADGSVHHELILPGQSVTGHFYVQVSQMPREAVWWKRCYKWQGEWFLHHDNALSHTSLVVQQLLSEKNIPVITQPPFSPDLAPSDF